MGAILRPFPNGLFTGGRNQPIGASGIDWTNGITQNLVGLWLPGQFPVFNLVDGVPSTLVSSPVPTMDVVGPSMNCQTNNGYAQVLPTGSVYLGGQASYTIVSLAEISANLGGSGPGFYCERATTGNDI